ncbi:MULTISPECIES: replication initiation and membrane attachment family protein [Bacillaceae]|jgi:replication initiation and membrane attachment protein|uniref:Replication initiation and membrane attachment protein n=2 Tax=Bacillaceae TaxID=186817 RepID=A0A090KU80_9BACI|nr:MULTISPECIES: DnaD domain protein [Bacillaceae]MCB5933409.1 DnaD domain protein [Bacillus sp. DFI.2.34]KIO65021.1 hypothetical protein B4065_0293 [Caldibacillus thermoamylovorans]MCB7069324.1 DnaD domain protein [Caldibacillus sp. 210928-DFI.2.22]MCB7072735.1 DnaD domain protein [Caldibacillus sp. 210928-DFI.2.18]MCB7076550.1 DnaD domain protein [Caldibacillus thermoamylovorans]
MEPHWKELIPGDQYIVWIEGPLNVDDSKVLTLLYQPLIGPICVSLYMTLLNQIGKSRLQSEPASHYYIMNLLDLNLAEIYNARKKLEAIGLLESFVKKNNDSRSFLYILKPPLSPRQFFTDGLLNIYLYQKIGHDYYQRLKHDFADEAINTDGFEKITQPFQQVFGSTHSFPYEALNAEDDAKALPGKMEAKPVTVAPDFFDFDLFMAGLDEAVVPKTAITKKVKEVILKLAFLYGIDAIQMKNIVMGSLNVDNEVDMETLRKRARDWYKIEHYNSLPKLIDRTQSPIYESDTDVPKTKEDRLVRYLETVSPRQVLTDLSDGSEPAESDLRLIEEIMINQKLNSGVVNVLIQYCMLRTDMKLSKAFVEKIASHWARKKIKTVKEAMALAKDEHRKYIEWQQNKKNKPTSKRKAVRTEKVPDWLENRNDGQEKQNEKVDIELKKSLEERLKKYRK